MNQRFGWLLESQRKKILIIEVAAIHPGSLAHWRSGWPNKGPSFISTPQKCAHGPPNPNPNQNGPNPRSLKLKSGSELSCGEVSETMGFSGRMSPRGKPKDLRPRDLVRKKDQPQMAVGSKNRNSKMACPGKWKHGYQNLRFAPPG